MPHIACSPKGRHCCLQRGVNATLLADCSRAGLCVSPWQDRQFSWLRTLCWNGNPEHQVSGWSSKSCSLFVAALKGHSRNPSRSSVCGGDLPLQKTLSLFRMGSPCQVQFVFLNSGHLRAAWGSCPGVGHSSLPCSPARAP